MIDSLRWLLAGLTTFLFIVDLFHAYHYLSAAERAGAREGKGGRTMSRRLYHAFFVAFYLAMIFALLAPSLPLMWVAIELTTLVSAPLIAFHRSRGSLEAMWKYLLICSIGIAFALFGTMLVMHAAVTGNSTWYKAGFAFALAGYGTKTGLAPFHTWLPDAHSEAPAPVSALLSGALLNCSFFAIARFRAIMPPDVAPFADGAMLTLGLLSVATATVFMVRQTDFKRLLAYSSVEHMGVIVVLFALFMRTPVDTARGFAIGFDGAVCGDLLLCIALETHIVFHSLTKTMLFQTAGNLMLAFGTRAIAAVRGLGVSMKGHATLWIVGTLFICAMPPSTLFLTELAIVAKAPIWISAVLLFLLFAVFAAMTKIALAMTMGEPARTPVAPLPVQLSFVPFTLLALIALAGVAASALAVAALV